MFSSAEPFTLDCFWSLHDIFDATMTLALFSCVLLCKKIAPLFEKKTAYGACTISLTISTICIICARLGHDSAILPGVICGGIGIALTILLWSELYGCLNPTRIILYYSSSILMGAAIIWLLRALTEPWLLISMLVLPFLSSSFLKWGFRSMPDNDRPHPASGSFSFPIKIALLMAMYAFAYGMIGGEFANPVVGDIIPGQHSSLGTIAISLVIIIGVVSLSERFDLDSLERIALPLMVCAFLVLRSFAPSDSGVSGFCASASYTAFSILVMTVFAGQSYRHGVPAVWLFGIERGIRTLCSIAGRHFAQFGSLLGFGQPPSSHVTIFVAIILALIGALVFVTGKELSGRWGVYVEQLPEKDEYVNPYAQRRALEQKCAEIARTHDLSRREEEVLAILAMHKTIKDVEQELVIANGTAKTHIKHIYRKLDIHSRDELWEKCGTLDWDAKR